MPRMVAILTLVSGVAVGVFGVAFARIAITEPEPAPRVSLEPVRPDRQPDAGNVVHGRVVRSGGEPLAGRTVTLRPAFDGGKTRRTVTDGDGSFAFVGAGVTPGNPYVAEVDFDGATFPSEMLRSPRPLEDAVRIVVAPTTKKSVGLSVRVESIAVVGDENGLQALHVLTVRNRSRRAFVGGLHLPLLPNATAIDPATGLVRRFLKLGEGEFISRAPVLPGDTDITYTYVAPMGTPPLHARYHFRYRTNRFELLVGNGLRAEAVGPLKKAGAVRLGEAGEQKSYDRIAAADLRAGDDVELRISPRGKNAVLTTGAIAGAIALSIAMLAFPIVRRRRKGADPADSPSAVEVR
jgi:hypothetical protein